MCFSLAIFVAFESWGFSYLGCLIDLQVGLAFVSLSLGLNHAVEAVAWSCLPIGVISSSDRSLDSN